MPENLDIIYSKSTSPMAGSVPGTGEILMRKRVSDLAPMELMVDEKDKESVH